MTTYREMLDEWLEDSCTDTLDEVVDKRFAKLTAERDALRLRVAELEPIVLDGLKAETLLIILVESLRGIPHDEIGNGSITKEVARDFLEFANRRLPELRPGDAETARLYKPSVYAQTQIDREATRKASEMEGKQ